MRFGKIGLAVATASLVASPVLAQSAAPAAKLSVSATQSQSVRVGSAVSADEAKLEGGSGIIIAILAAAAVIAGIIIAADGNANTPTSP